MEGVQWKQKFRDHSMKDNSALFDTAVRVSSICSYAISRFRVHSRDILMQGVVRQSLEPEISLELAFLYSRNAHLLFTCTFVFFLLPSLSWNTFWKTEVALFLKELSEIWYHDSVPYVWLMTSIKDIWDVQFLSWI